MTLVGIRFRKHLDEDDDHVSVFRQPSMNSNGNAIDREGLSLLKNLSDHGVRSSATVTVGHAQNLSVLGIRSP